MEVILRTDSKVVYWVVYKAVYEVILMVIP